MYIDHFCTTIAVYTTSILKGGLQPLHYAASGGHLDIIRRLIEVYKVPPDSAATVRQNCLYSIRNRIPHQCKNFAMYFCGIARIFNCCDNFFDKV